MDNGIIVFSRFDSSRLPGKVLRDLGGRPLLGRCLDRARRIAGARVVVATSDRAVDDPIAEFCRGEAVPCFQGSADDVAGRALACARHFGFQRFARVCGDSPFFPDDLVSRLLDVQRLTGVDVACNVHPRTYPAGASAEVVATDAMARLVACDPDDDDREHCTQYFYRHPESFSIYNTRAPEAGWRAFRMVVDTPEDLAHATAVIARLGCDPAGLAWPQVFAAIRQGGVEG